MLSSLQNVSAYYLTLDIEQPSHSHVDYASSRGGPSFLAAACAATTILDRVGLVDQEPFLRESFMPGQVW